MSQSQSVLILQEKRIVVPCCSSCDWQCFFLCWMLNVQNCENGTTYISEGTPWLESISSGIVMLFVIQKVTATFEDNWQCHLFLVISWTTLQLILKIIYLVTLPSRELIVVWVRNKAFSFFFKECITSPIKSPGYTIEQCIKASWKCIFNFIQQIACNLKLECICTLLPHFTEKWRMIFLRLGMKCSCHLQFLWSLGVF